MGALTTQQKLFGHCKTAAHRAPLPPSGSFRGGEPLCHRAVGAELHHDVHRQAAVLRRRHFGRQIPHDVFVWR